MGLPGRGPWSPPWHFWAAAAGLIGLADWLGGTEGVGMAAAGLLAGSLLWFAECKAPPAGKCRPGVEHSTEQ